MKISYFAILSVILTLSLQSAYGLEASPISVSTDKANYSEGDIIHVSGIVSQAIFGYEINLMLFEPNGNMVSIDKLIVDSNNTFQTKLTTGSTLTKSGTYSVLAMYDAENSITKTTFSYEAIERESDQGNPMTDILLNFDFLDPDQKNILEHVDYKITVSENGVNVFETSAMSHSSIGKISIPMALASGQSYEVLIEVHGILFKPIPVETFSFSIMAESESIQTQFTPESGLKINLAINKDPSGDSKVIPEWLKNNAKWWTDGLIDDATFVQGTEYLLNAKIVEISELPYPASWMDKSIPSWVKNTAGWWADDLIPEDEYIKGIKYLVEKGVITV